jgi:hypothetical protein
MLPATQPITIRTSSGYLRVDNLTSYAYVGDGKGRRVMPPVLNVQSTILVGAMVFGYGHGRARHRHAPPPATGDQAAEHFLAYDPADPGGTQAIPPGSPVILVSARTGLFCRIAAYPAPTTQSGRRARGLLQTSTFVYGMLGDQPTAETATEFVYSSFGLEYQGVAMVAEGVYYPLLWSNSSTLSGTGTIIGTVVAAGGRSTLWCNCMVQASWLLALASAVSMGPPARRVQPGGLMYTASRARPLQVLHRQHWWHHQHPMSLVSVRAV